MSQLSKQIFISYASSDVKMEYVEAVAKAIKRCGYSPYFMKSELRDATKGQDYLSKQILHSILMLVLMDLKYAEGVKYEFEEVAKRGKKIGAYVFFQKYSDSTPKHIVQDVIIKHELKDVNYCRDYDLAELPDVVEKNLSDWVEKEMARREEEEEKNREEKRRIEEEKRKKEEEEKRAKVKRNLLYAAGAIALTVLFCLLVPYIISELEDNKGISDPPVVEGGGKDETFHGDQGEPPAADKRKILTGNKDVTPTGGKGEVVTTELSVMVPNTFAVVCDDELFSAGICDAVSQISPSITQSLDTTKAQWTISVKHSVQDIPKMLESDALQVEVSYLVNLKNNTENGKIITKTIKKRGRSIIQNRDDAIRNANEEATKEIANILNQYKNENI